MTSGPESNRTFFVEKDVADSFRPFPLKPFRALHRGEAADEESGHSFITGRNTGLNRQGLKLAGPDIELEAHAKK